MNTSSTTIAKNKINWSAEELAAINEALYSRKVVDWNDVVDGVSMEDALIDLYGRGIHSPSHLARILKKRYKLYPNLSEPPIKRQLEKLGLR